MKFKPFSCFVAATILTLSSCVPYGSTMLPTQDRTQPTVETVATSTPTIIPSPTEIMTTTPHPTLDPMQAKDVIRTYLREPMNCEPACFWGIIPGKTTLNEAINTFTHLGLPIKSTASEGKEFYGTRYESDSGLSIIVTLAIRNEVVTDLKVDITPETRVVGSPREWLAYSPEALIETYGMPSKVSVAVDTGSRSFFDLTMHFEEVDLVVEYTGYNIISGTATSPQICPLTDQFDYVGMWMGRTPDNPPSAGVPLEEATYMTIEEFMAYTTTDNDGACIDLRREIFP